MMPKPLPSTHTKRRVSHIMPRDTLTLIPVSSPVQKVDKRKRERKWEREQRPASFYIPVHTQERVTRPGGLRDAIRAIANRELVKVDDVAREFIDYGLHAYSSGALKVNAAPKLQSQKLQTNFDAAAVHWQSVSHPKSGSVELHIDQGPRIPSGKSKRKIVVLSYRWGDTKLHKKVIDIAAKHGTYPGDMAVLFLEFAVQHYLENRMQLTIRPTLEKTVVGWAKRGK